MRRSYVFAATLVAGLLFSSVSLAAPSWKDRGEAQRLEYQAKLLVRKGEFEEAAKTYKKADELVPSPRYKIEIAKLLIELGDFLQATELLRPLKDDKPQTYADRLALKQVEPLLEELDQRTPTIEVAVYQPEASLVTIEVDGDSVEPDDGAVPFNPGSYEVVARADGYHELRTTVELEDSSHEMVEISLKKKKVEKKEEEESSGGLSPIPGYVMMGLAGAGLGMGIGFGIKAIQTKNDVVRLYDCENDVCPPEAEDDLNTSLLNGDISTFSFIGAGVAGVTGAFLLGFADYGDAEGKDSDDDGTLSIEARPLVGPGFIGVSGRF